MKIGKSISSHAALFIHPLLWVLSKIVSFLKQEELFIYFIFLFTSYEYCKFFWFTIPTRFLMVFLPLDQCRFERKSNLDRAYTKLTLLTSR